tara:strand:- start:9727 stop:10587 length:861 start_codon:yes stop_codon:yes gene_type:complete
MSYGIIIKLIPFNALKVLFLKLLGAKIGKNFKIGYLSTISTRKYSNIVIGDFVTIGHNTNIKVSDLFLDNLSIIGNNVEINGFGKLSIGKSCYVPEIYIDTSGGVKVKDFSALPPVGSIFSHNYSDTWFKPGTRFSVHNVNIGKRVWIGAGASVINSNIGDESLIAAGSTVINNLPNNTFAIGNPARVLKENVLNDVDRDFINAQEFKKEIQEKFIDYNIGFFDLLGDDSYIDKKFTCIICNENKLINKSCAIPVFSISDNKIANMNYNMIPIVRFLREYGILLKC